MKPLDRSRRRGLRRALWFFAALAVLAAVDGFWIEPRLLMVRRHLNLDLIADPYRLVHLSDLHVRGETPALRKLVAGVARAQPDLIVITGDLVSGGDTLALQHPSLRAAAATIRQLRRVAPVVGVQGHSEFLGPVVSYLGDAGIDWLFNEGRYFGLPTDDQTDGGFLLLGLTQQVGRDLFPPRPLDRFAPLKVDGQTVWGRATSSEKNLYFHYDPPTSGLAATSGLADNGGPLSWSGYELTCEVRIDEEQAEVGIGVHSRYPLGEDRMLRLRRPGGRFTRNAPFLILPHGTAGTAGQFNTGVIPEVGRWYRLRLRTEVEPGVVVLRARVWPSEEPEPTEWQAWFEDRTSRRVEAGTVGLWTRDGGGAFRNLEVRSTSGALLLSEGLATSRRPAGWRDGTRSTRLAMALARSPQPPARVAAKTPRHLPRVLLSHVPSVAPEAAQRGIEVVLSGHTHGGQVRLPGLALVTRSSLGTHYDRGLFHFASPNAQGWTRLYINPGVGTSLLPVRFLCPPSYTVIELGRRLKL